MHLARYENEVIGEGCSVINHAHWRFYEFNMYKAEKLEERESIGLYNTHQYLWTDLALADDLFA